MRLIELYLREAGPCPSCGTQMKDLFSSTYCPKCDANDAERAAQGSDDKKKDLLGLKDAAHEWIYDIQDWIGEHPGAPTQLEIENNWIGLKQLFRRERVVVPKELELVWQEFTHATAHPTARQIQGTDALEKAVTQAKYAIEEM